MGASKGHRSILAFRDGDSIWAKKVCSTGYVRTSPAEVPPDDILFGQLVKQISRLFDASFNLFEVFSIPISLIHPHIPILPGL